MEDPNNLQEKLRARRQALEISMQSQNNMDSDADEEHNLVEELEMLETEEDESQLRSILESRREVSRRKLESTEQDGSVTAENVDDILSTPRTPVAIPDSRRSSRGPASPRTDTESRSSTPFGRSTTPGGTLRSRLQAKLQASKRAAAASPTDDMRPASRTRRLRDRMNMSTRFDESIKEETKIKETQLLEKVESKLKWKRAADQARADQGQPSDADCFDFFTKQYEDIQEADQPAEEEPKPELPPEGEEVTPQEDQPGTSQEAPSGEQDEEIQPAAEETADQTQAEEEKRLISDIVTNEFDYRLHNMQAAEYRGYNNQLDTENLYYFVPSMLAPDLRSKVEENAVPRYLEEEGFYVGRKPQVVTRNKNILENRLLQQPDRGQGWFGTDGEVETLPDPIKQVATKPWVESVDEVDPLIETVYVKAISQLVEDKYLTGSGEYELQVDIGTVVYLHHGLMSKEHVLASNMSQHYDEYVQRRHKNYVNFYVDKLAALRRAVVTLRTAPDDMYSSDVTAAMRSSRVHDFMSEIRRTSRQLSEAESSERDIMRKIIEEWRELKSVRESQGYNTTSVKLTVKREEVNYQIDLQRWEQEVEYEVDEQRDNHQTSVVQPYHQSLEKYQKQLQEWKKNRAKLKEQRRKMQLGSKENLLDVAETDDEVSDNIDKPQKPEKPANFDEDAVRTQIMDNLLEKRRNPGEPKLSLELTHTVNVTPITAVPALEVARRKAMQKLSVVLKLTLNGKEVFQTEPKTLTSDFKLHFGSIFRIRITQWPESLKVQFLEAGLVMNSLLNEVYLAVPETAVHSGNVQLGVVLFTSDRVETYEHEAVGSNTPFTLRQADPAPTSYNTRGQLISSVSWSLDENGRVLAPKGLVQATDPMSALDPVSAIGADGIQDPESLSKWVQDSRMDPNDPENAAFIPFMSGEQEGQGFLYAPDYFRLEQLQEEFNFVDDEDFGRMNRLRLLELRDKEVPEFRNLIMVPSQEHEVMDSAFTVYERRLRDKQALRTVATTRVEAGTISTHRLEVLRFRQLVKDAVMHRFYTARHYYTLEDMVHEDQVPDIKMLGTNLAKLVEPRRPLKPIRKDRKKATTQSLADGSVNVLVNVIRGYNLPVRTTGHTSTGTAALDATVAKRIGGTESMIQLGTTIPVNTFHVSPFVAIWFQGQVTTTSVTEGRFPNWSEELRLPFLAPNNDYSPSSLQTVDDSIYVHLFDKTIEEAKNNMGDDSSLIVHRVQNHWLGSWKLPFSTVYQRGKVDGTFKLKVPPVLLGYDVDVQSPTEFRNMQIDPQSASQNKGTFLTLFITLDPILKPSEAPRPKFESQEDEQTLKLCALFNETCSKKFPDRHVKTTVVDLKGESVLITRYVHPVQPPPELTEASDPGSVATAERLARYVALIPSVSDNVAYAGICDLWSTCDQFVHMLYGDEEEHAVLLLNFFLYLGKKAYLVLGSAVPEGNTAFVLTVNEATKELTFWNASTGRSYDQRDNLTPFQSVGALVNAENVWFNWQSNDAPSRVRFDVLKKADWKPLFTSSNPRPTTVMTIQPDVLSYAPVDRTFIASLTDSIERTLKERISSWRPRHVTRWNRTCNEILHGILRSLESVASRRKVESNHGQELMDKLGNVRFTGFPMDMPYTTVEDVISAVRSTEVHKIDDRDVEFSIAVYVHSYPGSVLAVWVYVAALVNKRRHDL